MVPAFHLPKAVRYKDAIRRGSECHLHQGPDVGPNDIAVLQYTGGTTGVSKGAVLLHRNVIANALQCEAWSTPW